MTNYPVFKGIHRPASMLGMPYIYAAGFITLPTVVFCLSMAIDYPEGLVLAIALGLVIFIFGRVSLRDGGAKSTIWFITKTSLQNTMSAGNKQFWKGRTYDPF